MKGLLLAGMLSFCVGTGYAQSLPDAPKPKKAVWIAETVTLGGLYAADYTLTARGLGQRACVASGGRTWCGPMLEGDPLFGRRPGDARLATTGAAVFAVQAWALHRTESSRHGWIRWAGRAGFAYQVVSEVRGIHSWKR